MTDTIDSNDTTPRLTRARRRIDAVTSRLPDGRWLRLAVMAASAAGINLALFGLGHGAGADMLVPDTADPDTFIDLPAGLVVVASIVPVVIAALISAAIRPGFLAWRGSTSLPSLFSSSCPSSRPSPLR